MNADPPTSAPVSFASQIKPLFRPFDRQSMIGRFDLWSLTDVRVWAERIHQQVSEGNMPCDAPWSQESIDLFGDWIAGGMQP